MFSNGGTGGAHPCEGGIALGALSLIEGDCQNIPMLIPGQMFLYEHKTFLHSSCTVHRHLFLFHCMHAPSQATKSSTFMTALCPGCQLAFLMVAWVCVRVCRERGPCLTQMCITSIFFSKGKGILVRGSEGIKSAVALREQTSLLADRKG